MTGVFRSILPVIAGLIIGSSGASALYGYDRSEKILPPQQMVEKTLPNGLSYVIMPNSSPSKMVECRIIFRTGSVMETPGNRGAAHFLEHIAFGGTEHFPGRSLVECLESAGAQYGWGINAYTGQDRTVYMFYIPSDDPKVMDDALLILKDWLCGISVDEAKVEGEKGIILEELRDYDLGDPFYRLKIGNSAYSHGIPLGTEKDIRRITKKTLLDFHKKWYTPDRATLAFVGDVNPSEMEARISDVFGDVPRNRKRFHTEFTMTYPAGISLMEVEDTLVQRAKLEFIVPHSAVMKATLDDAVLEARNGILMKALRSRFNDTDKDATLSNNWYLADKEHFVVELSGKGKSDVMAAAVASFAELHRIAREGFAEGEIDAACAGFRCYSPYEASSAGICTAIEETVILGDRAVTDEKQVEWVRSQVKATTSADLQSILSAWIEEAERTLLAAYTYNPQLTDIVTEKDIREALQQASETVLPPYTFSPKERAVERPRVSIPAFLIQERAFDPSLIVERKQYPNIGVTEVLCSNGFRLVLRPTQDIEEKIQCQIFAPGGLSRISEEDYARYEGFAGYMELGGIEGMADEEWFSMLPENDLGILLAMESYWHGIIASAPSSSQRLLFNAIREKMLHPGLNYEEFEEIRKEEEENFGEESYLSRLMKYDVNRQVAIQIDSLMGNLTYGRRLDLTMKDLEEMNLDSMADLYRKLYSNPDGMTCVICGSFDVDSLIAEAVPVFGSIPSVGDPNRMGPSHFSLPTETVKREWENANESQTIFDYLRFGEYEPSMHNGLKLKIIRGIIQNRLINVMREQESLVYSPYVSVNYKADPDPVFYFDISASVECGNTVKVRRVLDDIFRDLQENRVSEKELSSLRKILLVNKRTSLEDDATAAWKGWIVSELKNRESLSDMDRYEEVLEGITAEEIQRDFREDFDTTKYMILSIGPF